MGELMDTVKYFGTFVPTLHLHQAVRLPTVEDAVGMAQEITRLRQFAEAVVSPCEWGPTAFGCDDDETIAEAAERCGIFRKVPHQQPCEVEGCECDGGTELLYFAWSPVTVPKGSTL